MPSTKELSREDSIFLLDSLPAKLYYFAYGSNMNSLQIKKRCATPEKVTIARLSDYRIGFFGHSVIWDGALETVIREPGHDVWGVVYDIGAMDMEKLDSWQDVRMDGTGAYFHYPARVNGVDGQMYTVLFYKKDTLGKPQNPSKPYLDFIIAGAMENKLSAGYINELRAIHSKPAAYPVPKTRTFNPENLLACDCSTCSP